MLFLNMAEADIWVYLDDFGLFDVFADNDLQWN